MIDCYVKLGAFIFDTLNVKEGNDIRIHFSVDIENDDDIHSIGIYNKKDRSLIYFRKMSLKVFKGDVLRISINSTAERKAVVQ